MAWTWISRHTGQCRSSTKAGRGAFGDSGAAAATVVAAAAADASVGTLRLRPEGLRRCNGPFGQTADDVVFAWSEAVSVAVGMVAAPVEGGVAADLALAVLILVTPVPSSSSWSIMVT
jgi:hypothetical protein